MNEPTASAAEFAAPLSVPANTVNVPFQFSATGAEYFRIWIVNLLLTIVTLGIYSAWAKVRRLRYFYGSTHLDGHAFEYHGKPLAILKGRLIVLGAYVAFIIVIEIFPLMVFPLLPAIIFGVPWIIMRARMFQMRMSSFRNVRFNFHGTYGQSLAAFIGWYLLVILTLGLLFPVWTRKRVAYSLGNAAYGNTRFNFLTGNGEFYRFWIISILLSIALYAGFFVLLFSQGFFTVMQNPDPDAVLMQMLSIGSLVMILLFAALSLGIFGYYEANFTNASFGGVEVGPLRVVSKLRAWPLAWIYISNLFGILITLGLFYPWAKVRQARYQLENTSLDTPGGLGEFTASQTQATDAVGEEIGDFFDVDFGL